MKLKRITEEEFQHIKHSERNKYADLINDFLRSGDKYAELIGYNHYRPENCTMMINRYLRRFEITEVKASTKGGRVFLCKTPSMMNERKENEDD